MAQVAYKVMVKGHCVEYTTKHVEALNAFKDAMSFPRQLIKIHEDGRPEMIASLDHKGRTHEHA